MSLSFKIKKTWWILHVEGAGAVIRNVIAQFLVLFDKSHRPSETSMVFAVLRAEVQRGVMIDVGAHYGGSLAPFANNGWSVYAFEPDSGNRCILEKSFDRLENVTVDDRAVSDRIQENVPYYKSKESTGISGLHPFHNSHVESQTVTTVTLRQYTEENEIDAVDFLKIDTEGFDFFVLKGFPWERMSPRVIVCEFEDSKTAPMGYSFHDMARFLQERGYALLVSEWFPIKKYGSFHDWRSYAEYPCELRDEKAWGNIIAAREQKDFDLLTGAFEKIEKARRTGPSSI